MKFPHLLQRGCSITMALDTRMRGFSLVEVVLAMAIVSTSMLAILGLLPIGLNTVQESMVQTATASIAQQIRGELQQIAFSGTGTTIAGLASTTSYYTAEGIKTEVNRDPYYVATFALPSSTSAGGATFTPSNAQTIQVTLSYPKIAIAANRKNVVFSFFAANQND